MTGSDAAGAGEPPEPEAFSAAVVHRLRNLVAGLPEPIRALVASQVENPGKCLRSSLLGACARLGTPDRWRAVRLGALVELLHLASLLHDDVVDRAAVRRGRPAAHAVAGNEMAMLAGLACFALAGTEAADIGEEVAATVSRTAADLAYGELLDVERAFDTTLALPDYVELVERKTGELFRLSCVLGAAEGRLDETLTYALAGFGVDLGVAFQILDDCLDLEILDDLRDLEPDGSAKPAGTDHMLGLFGAPALCALREDHTGELAALLLAPSFGADDLAAVRSLIVARGGLTTARALARERHDRALTALDTLPRRAAREELVQVAASAWRDPA